MKKILMTILMMMVFLLLLANEPVSTTPSLPVAEPDSGLASGNDETPDSQHAPMENALFQ